jgi:phenylpropionate dioxygenase-like ring-hydroxylating dioxygenase large terminal subunit
MMFAEPRESHDPAPAFHCCWYPVALAAEVPAGTVRGQDFLGSRVVIYRDADGKPVVQSAWCPHLGADLSVGQVVEGRIRCAYHHWSYDKGGACVEIPAGDRIPREARIATYPSAEAWGMIWAFNGKDAPFPPPVLPDAGEHDLLLRAERGPVRAIEPWVPTSNGVDFQHLRTLHGLKIETPPLVETGADGLEFTMATPHYLQHGRIAGTNCFAQHLRVDGLDMFMMFAGLALARQKSQFFRVIAVKRGPQQEAQLAVVKATVDRLLSEDAPVLETIRFRKGVLVPSDRHLARFLHYVEAFPAAPPLDCA